MGGVHVSAVVVPDAHDNSVHPSDIMLSDTQQACHMRGCGVGCTASACPLGVKHVKAPGTALLLALLSSSWAMCQPL